MFTEELNLIKKTEDEAEALRRAARMEARKLVDDARAEAARIAAEAEAEAKARFDARLQEGQETAQAQYEDALAEAERQCSGLAEKAALAEKACIEMIAERIVKSSVNN